MLAATLLYCPAKSYASATYYAKAKASVASTDDGKGLVYVSKDEETEHIDKFGKSSEKTASKQGINISFDGAKPTADINFTYYAIPSDGYVFDYWKDENENKFEGNPYEKTIDTSSKDENNPETYELEAHFAIADDIIEMNMSAAGVATFASPYITVIPKKCNAYGISSYDYESHVMTLSKVADAGDILQPNTPVIIIAEEGAKTGCIAKSYGLKARKGSENLVSSKGLSAYYENGEKVSAGSYVLQVVDGEIGFYRVDSEIPATPYRCFFDPSSAPVVSNDEPEANESKIRVVFAEEGDIEAEETTAISDVEATGVKSADDAVYSISGQKLDGMKSGVNIIRENGKVKKVIK